MNRLPFQGRPDITQALINERRFNIQKKLLADSIDRAKALSPEEINALNSEKLFDMNAPFSRLTNELLTPTIMRVLDILQRKGLVADFKFDKKVMAIKYTSPLATLQDLQTNQLYIQTISQLDQVFGPQVSEKLVDKNEMARKILENSNIDASLINTRKKVESTEEEQQKAQQAAAIADQQQQQG